MRDNCTVIVFLAYGRPTFPPTVPRLCPQHCKKVGLLEVLGHRLADGIHFEANGSESRVGQNVAAVEHECGLAHAVIDALEVQRRELVPLCHHSNSVGILQE